MEYNKLYEAAVRSLVIHIATEAQVGYEYAIEQMQLVCDELIERGDKAINGRDLVNLTVMRIRQQQSKNN